MSSPKAPSRPATVSQQHDVPVQTVQQSPEGKPLRFCDSARTTKNTELETTLYTRCDGFEKVILARPATGQPFMRDVLQVGMGGAGANATPTVYVANQQFNGGIRPCNAQMVQEIIGAMKRSYADGVLSVDEDLQWKALKQQVYAAAADGKFSPAEENAVIVAAKKIASAGGKQK